MFCIKKPESQHLSYIAIYFKSNVLVVMKVALFSELYETDLENGSETRQMLIIAT